MSSFNIYNFEEIVHEIEDVEEEQTQASWIAIGILEKMYDDDAGYIDEYFISQSRDIDNLINKIFKMEE